MSTQHGKFIIVLRFSLVVFNGNLTWAIVSGVAVMKAVQTVKLAAMCRTYCIQYLSCWMAVVCMDF